MKRLILLLAITPFFCSVIAQNKQTVATTFKEPSFLTNVLVGNVFFTDNQIAIDDLPWNPHPKYKGVYLKHLISGKDTDNGLSCHIVKIEPNCMLDTHVHDGKIEIHEVVGGYGTFYLDGKEIDYSVGCISLIPSNTSHKVVAGKDGLYLFAKFTPALE